MICLTSVQLILLVFLSCAIGCIVGVLVMCMMSMNRDKP
jgi:hypothetical protein